MNSRELKVLHVKGYENRRRISAGVKKDKNDGSDIITSKRKAKEQEREVRERVRLRKGKWYIWR